MCGLILVMAFLVTAVMATSYDDCPIAIDRFGAVAGTTTNVSIAVANGEAVTKALYFANSNPGDCKTVVVPNATYTIIPGPIVSGLWSVTFRIDGTLDALDAIDAWPNQVARPWKRRPVIHIVDSTGVVVEGHGTVNGHGYNWWWWVVFTGPALDPRPYLLEMENCIDTQIRGLTFIDAPEYHVFIQGMVHAIVEDVTVHVDIFAQEQLLRKAGKWIEAHPVLSFDQLRQHGLLEKWRGLPMFPLNTDGIDVAGRNITVRRCKVTNFDDAICVKPTSMGSNLTNCSQDILFDDVDIHYSVGASMGSVGPGNVNCIRNVVVSNIRFDHPIKGLYVKPNPCGFANGTCPAGVSGVIDNVRYENISMVQAMWWTIWVSTQQEVQPGADGTNTGCSFFYPLPGTVCRTDPRVPVTNLKMRNITAVDSWLSPGVLRCSEDGPCTGWEWDNVQITSITKWPLGDHFLCQGLVQPSFVNVNVTCVANFSTPRN